MRKIGKAGGRRWKPQPDTHEASPKKEENGEWDLIDKDNKKLQSENKQGTMLEGSTLLKTSEIVDPVKYTDRLREQRVLATL